MGMPNGSIEGRGTADCECGQPRGNREVRMANLEGEGLGENCDSEQPSEGTTERWGVRYQVAKAKEGQGGQQQTGAIHLFIQQKISSSGFSRRVV
jgi:hypothetical protein